MERYILHFMISDEHTVGAVADAADENDAKIKAIQIIGMLQDRLLYSSYPEIKLLKYKTPVKIEKWDMYKSKEEPKQNAYKIVYLVGKRHSIANATEQGDNIKNAYINFINHHSERSSASIYDAVVILNVQQSIRAA